MSLNMKITLFVSKTNPTQFFVKLYVKYLKSIAKRTKQVLTNSNAFIQQFEKPLKILFYVKFCIILLKTLLCKLHNVLLCPSMGTLTQSKAIGNINLPETTTRSVQSARYRLYFALRCLKGIISQSKTHRTNKSANSNSVSTGRFESN